MTDNTRRKLSVVKPADKPAQGASSRQSNIIANQLAGAGRNTRAMQNAQAGASMAGRIFKIIMILAILGAGYYFGKPFIEKQKAEKTDLKESDAPAKTNHQQEKLPDSAKMSITQKMTEANRILSDFERQALPAAQMVGRNLTDKKIVEKHSSIMADATHRYNRRFNNLKLPCPTTPEARKYVGYLQWSKRFEKRQEEIFARVNKAARGGH